MKDSFDPCLGRLSLDLAGGCDSPGVDHGIQRTAVRLVEAHGIAWHPQMTREAGVRDHVEAMAGHFLTQTPD
jgi:hypothetical protein